MSGAELGRRAGIKQSSISRRITGEVAFDMDDLEAIADVLGVAVGDLLPRAVGAGRGATDVLNGNLAQPQVPARNHVVRPSGGRPAVRSRTDSVRPVSAVPLNKRRPVSVRPANRPMAS